MGFTRQTVGDAPETPEIPPSTPVGLPKARVIPHLNVGEPPLPRWRTKDQDGVGCNAATYPQGS
jgi:hypothetical protein